MGYQYPDWRKDMRKWLLSLIVLGLLAPTALAGGDKDKHPGRLVVADARVGQLLVLDLEKGEVVGRFSAPGPAVVYPAPGGQYAFAIHREQNRVSIVFTGLGLEDHGDHKDLVLQSPYIWATINTGPRPTHFKSHANQIVIYNDGDGTMAVFDAAKLGLVPDFDQIATGAPDHGAPVALGSVVLAGSLNRGAVEVYSRGGRRITSFAGCPRLHGQAVLGSTVAYGCADGVLLLEQRGSGFVSRKLANPAGTPERVRVGTLVAHPQHPFFIGNFGQGLARIDAAIRPLPLPANPVRFGFDKDGQLVVLTADGRLHTLEAATGRVLASLQVLKPIAAGTDTIRPALALGDGMAYLTNPAAGEILEVDLAQMQLKRRFNVGGTPGSLAWLWVDAKRH
jgi:DNA-binding beta-propeller fold protein YncE